MPSATYFRLKILCENKSKLELSAIHLYNDSIRVDETATISTGFTSNTTDIDILKNTVPIENTALTINDTSLVRKSTLSIVWNFSSATNVNAFRIGTGESQLTMVDKFHLSYSTDGINYINFISIGTDKKLSYPGPWQLSALKPMGEGFPLVLRRGKDFTQSLSNFLTVDEDGRSFHGIKTDAYPIKNPPINFPTNGWMGANYYQEIPGFYKSGKYYFEVSLDDINLQDISTTTYNYIALALIPDNTERILRAQQPTAVSPVFTINTFHSGSMPVNGNFANGGLLAMGSRTQFTPGYQIGFSIDFDNKELKYYNPSYNTSGYGPFSISNSTTVFNNIAAGTSYKLFFFFYNSFYCIAGNVRLNVGQSAFNNTVPAGFQSGLGPRWQEEVDSVNGLSYIDNDFSPVNEDYFPMSLDVNPAPLRIVQNKASTIVSGGQYFIKGYITRTPDIENKRFIAFLFSSSLRRVVAQCLISSSGLYEFYGIEYGAYTVLSMDYTNNTVSETIGPVYPSLII